MIKKILTGLLLVNGFIAFSQYEGFEKWVSSSVKILNDYETRSGQSDGNGGFISLQSTDKYSGNYSVKLETYSDGKETVFSFFVNGDVDSLTGGQTVTINDIDSIIGYYKCDIAPNDSAVILCLPRLGKTPTATVGSAFYFRGTQPTWKRFAFKVGATMSDSVLIAGATGDPLNNFNGVVGSYIMFDDIQLKASNGTKMDILNGSFENWTDIIWEEPIGWSGYTPLLAMQNVSVLPITKTTDKYADSFAVELTTIVFNSDTIGGSIGNGKINFNDTISRYGGMPFTGSPTSYEFYYKFNPTGVDTAFFSIKFKKNGTLESQYGGAILAKSSYTKFSSNMTPMNPDSVLIEFYAGRNPGSKLLIDNLNFIFPVGTNELLSLEKIVSYPNPTTDRLNIRFNLKTQNTVTINLIDINGKVLKAYYMGSLNSGVYNEIFNTSDFKSGIYFIEFVIGEERMINRFVIK